MINEIAEADMNAMENELRFLKLEDIHDVLGDVNGVKGDDLEDHGEEDKRVSWNDNIDQS